MSGEVLYELLFVVLFCLGGGLLLFFWVFKNFFLLLFCFISELPSALVGRRDGGKGDCLSEHCVIMFLYMAGY